MTDVGGATATGDGIARRLRRRWLRGAAVVGALLGTGTLACGWVLYDRLSHNITPDEATGIGRWSHDEIVQALATGFTPEFDSLGGEMASVVQNIGHLTAADQSAMADYLKAIPPINNPKPQK